MENNLATIIVSLILLIITAVIIYKLVKDRKQGKKSCGYNCNGCPNSCLCHKKNSKK